MTDQETLNKLFEAALKEPEKPQACRASSSASTTTAAAPSGSGHSAAAVARNVASARNMAFAIEDTHAEPTQAKQESPAAESPEPTTSQPEEEPPPQDHKTEESPTAMSKAKSGKGLVLAIAPIAIATIGGAIWFFALR